jgi:hydroxyacylglutathione hydrolase
VKNFIREIAKDVWQLGLLGQTINAYLIGDVLIDSGIRSSGKVLEQLLQHHPVRAHALTHAHADHQGSSAELCRARGLPLWVHECEVGVMEQGAMLENIPQNLVTRLQQRFWWGEAHPVARGLKAGDDVHGFEVLETPGHSLGHISLWRESDGVLIVGDVLTNINLLTLRPGLHEPLGLFTLNQAQNHTQIAKLAVLMPRVALFGHGAPLRDPEALARLNDSVKQIADSSDVLP